MARRDRRAAAAQRGGFRPPVLCEVISGPIVNVMDAPYGPTDTDPDPGKRWHAGCGGEVYGFDDGLICNRCGEQEEPESHPADRISTAPEPPIPSSGMSPTTAHTQASSRSGETVPSPGTHSVH